MRLVKFELDGRCGEGVVVGDLVHVVGNLVAGAADDAPFTLPGLSADALAAASSRGERISLSDVALAVPVDPARKLICVGMNYRDHTAEIAVEVATNPVLFTRSLDSLVAAVRSLCHPRISDSYDYEGEIAIVIGEAGRHIPAVQAMRHVLGYSCFLDGSVREYQRHSLTAGKNFRRSGGMGPWIVTADEVGDHDLALQTRLNGAVVQKARASDMIFGIAETIAYCSRFTRLMPGDVIATGTPGGVGSRRTPPLWMKPGDVIEVEVDRVGLLTHEVE